MRKHVGKALAPFRPAWNAVEDLDCIELIVLALVPLVRFSPWAVAAAVVLVLAVIAGASWRFALRPIPIISRFVDRHGGIGK